MKEVTSPRNTSEAVFRTNTPPCPATDENLNSDNKKFSGWTYSPHLRGSFRRKEQMSVTFLFTS